jgi:hypothetical protein
MDFLEALGVAVEAAAPIVTDGAANTIGPGVLAAARAAVASPQVMTLEQAESLAEVAVLGWEYWQSGVELDDRERAALDQLGEVEGSIAPDVIRWFSMGWFVL